VEALSLILAITSDAHLFAHAFTVRFMVHAVVCATLFDVIGIGFAPNCTVVFNVCIAALLSVNFISITSFRMMMKLTHRLPLAALIAYLASYTVGIIEYGHTGNSYFRSRKPHI